MERWRSRPPVDSNADRNIVRIKEGAQYSCHSALPVNNIIQCHVDPYIELYVDVLSHSSPVDKT